MEASPRISAERSVRAAGMLALAGAPLITTVAALAALAWTGQLATELLGDPGAPVRYGLPVTRVVHDVAAAATIGLLLVPSVLLPDEGRDRWNLDGLRARLVRWAGCAACLWAASLVVLLALTCADATGFGLLQNGFGEQLWFFASQLDLGRSLLAAAVLVLLCAHLALLATGLRTAAWSGAAAAAAMLPLALGGHVAGSNDHANAVNALFVHLLAVTVWVGGAAALLVVALLPISRGAGPVRLDRPAQRFSTVAGWCFAAVAFSGVLSAWLRLGDLQGLFTGYGAIVVVKAAALVGLGLAGRRHRSALLPALQRNPRDRAAFIRLLAVELLVMALAMGLAVALSRTAPPQPAPGVSDGTPPALTVPTLLTQWHIDWVALALILLALAGYLAGVHRLGDRGESWPRPRIVFWSAGCLLLLWLTSGGPAVYGAVLSAHVLMQLLLTLAVPPLLVGGAPLTLALATLPARPDSSAGPREWLRTIEGSRVLAVLNRPLIAAAVLAASLAVHHGVELDGQRLSGLARGTHSGYLLTVGYFLGLGCLIARNRRNPAGRRAQPGE